MNTPFRAAVALLGVIASLALPVFAIETRPSYLDFAGSPVTLDVERAAAFAPPSDVHDAALDLVFEAGAGYPSVRLNLGAGRDLSAFIGIEAELTNLDAVEHKVLLRVDNDGDWQKKPWNSEVDSLAPGETKTIAVTFGQSYGAAGYKLDPTAVTGVLLSVSAPEQRAKLRLRRLAPVGGKTETVPTTSDRPASSAIMEDMDYALVWGDEFNRDGRPDPTKWDFELGPKLRNNELSHYTDRPENVRVRSGNLVIEARREAYQGSAYTSASLTTRETHPFVYGRLEVRAKLPRGRGIWPAIWMLGWHNEKAWWPEVGEIDLMEHVGYEPGSLFFTIHTLERNHMKKNPVQATLPVQGIYDDYHLYRLDWTPTEVALFFDDREVLRQRKTGEGIAAWPFTNPMYLILNVAVGGDWGGAKGVDDAVFPQRMLVDYVRLYKVVPRQGAAPAVR